MEVENVQAMHANELLRSLRTEGEQANAEFDARLLNSTDLEDLLGVSTVDPIQASREELAKAEIANPWFEHAETTNPWLQRPSAHRDNNLALEKRARNSFEDFQPLEKGKLGPRRGKLLQDALRSRLADGETYEAIHRACAAVDEELAEEIEAAYSLMQEGVRL